MEDARSNDDHMDVDFKYIVAGGMSLAAAVLLLPYIVLSLVTEIRPHTLATLLPLTVLIGVLELICSIFAFIIFKSLLNERYRFHDVDNLFPIIIFGSIIIFFAGLTGKAFPGVRIPAMVLLIGTGIVTSITSIVFGVRLLRLRARMHGLLKPLAYTYIIASVFFLTQILAIIGLLVNVAGSVIMAIIFFSGREEDDRVDFV